MNNFTKQDIAKYTRELGTQIKNNKKKNSYLSLLKKRKKTLKEIHTGEIIHEILVSENLENVKNIEDIGFYLFPVGILSEILFSKKNEISNILSEVVGQFLQDQIVSNKSNAIEHNIKNITHCKDKIQNDLKKSGWRNIKNTSNEIFLAINKNVNLELRDDLLYTCVNRDKRTKVAEGLYNRTMSQEDYYALLQIGDPVIDDPNTPLEIKDWIMNCRDKNGEVDVNSSSYITEFKRIELEKLLLEHEKDKKKIAEKNRLKEEQTTKRKVFNNIQILDKKLVNEINKYCYENNFSSKKKNYIIRLLKRLLKNQGGTYKRDENFPELGSSFFEIIHNYGFTEIVIERDDIRGSTIPGGKDGKNKGKDNRIDNRKASLAERNNKKKYLKYEFLEGTIQKLTDLGYTFSNQKQFEKQFERLMQGRGLFDSYIKSFLSDTTDTSEKRLNYRKINIGGNYRRILITGKEKFTEIDGIYTHADCDNRVKELGVGGR